MLTMLDDIKSSFHQHILDLQDRITHAAKNIDPGLSLAEDHWERLDHGGHPGGGGRTRAIAGKIFENGGINISLIHGEMDEDFIAKISSSGKTLWATGISVILHPYNPRIPTVHANFRMIHAGDKYWFGGGADLTPYYPYEEDFRHFHHTWKKACQPWKTWNTWSEQCARYFSNKHRDGEGRGIGGIFFDYHNSGDLQKDFDMVVALSESFIPSYFPLASKRKDTPWDEADKDFQLHRRGRYVEFNLLHDRGTAFGLQSNGRTESILISLPGTCKFTYNYNPPPDSPHQKMMSYYKNHRIWKEF